MVRAFVFAVEHTSRRPVFSQRGDLAMTAPKRRTVGGGPLMTLFALLLLLLPFLSLGAWVTFTGEGKASLAQARQGVIANP